MGTTNIPFPKSSFIPTRILYSISNPNDRKTYEWTGELPLLHKDILLALPLRAAVRVTDVKLVLGPAELLEQVVFTGF